MPASLIANWEAEIERFAPEPAALVAHPRRCRADELEAARRPRARRRRPGHHQLRHAAAPALAARARPGAWSSSTRRRRSRTRRQADPRGQGAARRARGIALTGTPVENRLGDLWSIFDFLNPGLLGIGQGSSRSFVKRLADRPHNAYGPLRELVRPYILRRLKTDKRVIADLPDKTEVKAYCALSRAGGALPAGGRRSWRASSSDADGHPAARPRAGLPDALQADLQPPLAVARRRRAGPRPTAASSRACASSASDRGAAGEGAGLHPVPRDRPRRWRASSRRLRPARPRAARRDRGRSSARSWSTRSRRTRARRSSSSRSRPAARGST